MVTVIVGIKLI